MERASPEWAECVERVHQFGRVRRYHERMDVTPRELRDIDIREGFRGYNRDDVDELLERAATTIDGSNERIRRLTEQLAEVEGKQGKSREAEDMLQRTLLLAQRAADEAVAEAQIKARQILDDAETRARNALAEAESTARRQAETERARLEGEVLDLGARREALLADVAQLEKFEAEYRVRLRRALEADLESLAGQAASAAAPRPPIHEVDLPTPSSAPTPAPQSAAPPRVVPAPSPPPTPPPTPAPAPIAAVPNPAPVAAASASASAPNPGPPTAELSSVGEWNAPPARREPAARRRAAAPADERSPDSCADGAWSAVRRGAGRARGPRRRRVLRQPSRSRHRRDAARPS